MILETAEWPFATVLIAGQSFGADYTVMLRQRKIPLKIYTRSNEDSSELTAAYTEKL